MRHFILMLAVVIGFALAFAQAPVEAKAAQANLTVYGPFNGATIAPPPGSSADADGPGCPSVWIPWCDDLKCGSCNSWTSDHGHTCITCSGDDCNCAVGAPPWTHPSTGITYTNRWYPSVRR